MKNVNYYGFFIIYGTLFLLILNKVMAVPITCDEVPATLFYARFSFWEIMMYPDNIPNNHILNTLLTKCCIIFFGKEQWAVRLPNLLSFFIFGFAVFNILRHTLKNDSWYFLPAALLFVNPYLLDFFGLCRGYGLSSALLTLSLSYFISGFRLSNERQIWLALAMSIAASYANFTLLVFWAGATLLTWFYFLQKKGVGFSKLIKPTLLIALISILYLALIAVPIYKIHSTDELKYWSSQGFYQETIGSLIYYWRYDSRLLSTINTGIWASVVFIILSINSFTIIYNLRRAKFKLSALRNPVFVTTAMLFLTVGVNFIQTTLLKTPNLNGRTALFFYPLFSAALISCLSLIPPPPTKVAKLLPVILGIVCAVNLASRTRLKSVKEWAYDQNNLEVINFLKDQSTGKPVSLKTSWFFNPSFEFYVSTGKAPWIKLYPYDQTIDITTDAAYYYIFAEDYKLLEPRFEIAYKFSDERWLLKQKSHIQ